MEFKGLYRTKISSINKGEKILIFSVATIVGAYFFFLGLFKAITFLAPFLTAVILSLVVLPLSKKLENKIVKRSYSSLVKTFFLFLLSLAFLGLISFQVRSLVGDWPKIQETMKPKVEQLKTFVFDHTPMNKSDMRESDEKGSGFSFSGSISNRGQKAFNFFMKSVGYMGTYLLTLIYFSLS